MLTTWISFPLVETLRARRRRSFVSRRTSVSRPRPEPLEARFLPATVTWDGGGGTANWSDRFNWGSDVAPVSGDDLVFPAGAARRANFNNFPSGTLFRSLTFSGSGYAVSGGALNGIVLGAGGIVNSATTGANSYDGPIRLDAARTVEVARGGGLELGGVLSGGGGLTKTGGGSLTVNGPAANTYSGTTRVSEGSLALDKGDRGSAVAVPGELIVTTASGDASVRTFRGEQIADDATVTLTSSAGIARLILSDSETISAVNLTGGLVESKSTFFSTPSLFLNGDVTAQPSNAPTPAPSRILPRVSFVGAERVFTVNTKPTLPNIVGLVVSGDMLGATLVKEGTGIMELDGDADLSVTTEVNAGTLLVDGTLQNRAQSMILRDDATLGGTGQVDFVQPGRGVIGALETIDDADARFAATGWRLARAPGFGGIVHSAEPSVQTGSVVTASWVATGLPPGQYRILATWPAGASHTTRAAYSFFDNTALRHTAFVDQEQSSAGGPRDGGVAFEEIGDSVNVTSGTLRVVLSNVVSSEADGAAVIADAVRIERMQGTISPGGVGAAAVGKLVADELFLGTTSTYRVDFANLAPGVNSADQMELLVQDATGFGHIRSLLALSSTFFSPPRPGTAFRILTIDGSPYDVEFTNAPEETDTVELAAAGERHTFTVNYHAGDGNDVDLVYQNTATQARNLRLSHKVIAEGQRVSLLGALTDPNHADDLSLRVAWGDGAVETFTDLGTRPFRFTHTYRRSSPAGSPYVVHVSWFDDHGAGRSAELSATVLNVPPRLVPHSPAISGGLVHFTARFHDPGADTWTAVVDYGDGSGVQVVPVQPGKRLLLEHRYARPGRYRVAVTVADGDGGSSRRTFVVRQLAGSALAGRHSHGGGREAMGVGVAQPL